jgi:hypothetical protein
MPRNNTFGGYTAAQLMADPSLIARLGANARRAWQLDQTGRPDYTPGGNQQQGGAGIPGGGDQAYWDAMTNWNALHQRDSSQFDANGNPLNGGGGGQQGGGGGQRVTRGPGFERNDMSTWGLMNNGAVDWQRLQGIAGLNQRQVMQGAGANFNPMDPSTWGRFQGRAQGFMPQGGGKSGGGAAAPPAQGNGGLVASGGSDGGDKPTPAAPGGAGLTGPLSPQGGQMTRPEPGVGGAAPGTSVGGAAPGGEQWGGGNKLRRRPPSQSGGKSGGRR